MLRTQCRAQHVTEAASLRIVASKPKIAFDLRREPTAGCVRRSWYELASASLVRPKPSKQDGSESYGLHGNVGSGA